MAAVAPFGGTPTSTVRPRPLVSRLANAITSTFPVLSITTSAPSPPTIPAIASAGAVVRELIVCVAPRERARSRRLSKRSIATIG